MTSGWVAFSWSVLHLVSMVTVYMARHWKEKALGCYGDNRSIDCTVLAAFVVEKYQQIHTL